MEDREPDFSGWATKNDLKCSDGRIIKAGAFEHMDKMTVPLVWMHQHKEPENVLGHATLENRAFGVYTQGFFNDSERGQHMKKAVQHGDIVSLSIYANNLTEKATRNGKEVYHGDIKEVSLVVAGANPGAFIENVNLLHGDGIHELDEAIIYTGEELIHGIDIAEAYKTQKKRKKAGKKNKEKDMGDKKPKDDTVVEHAEDTATLMKEVFDDLTDDQKAVVYFMLGDAAEKAKKEAETAAAAEHDDISKKGEYLSHLNDTLKEGFAHMGDTRNLFETQGRVTTGGKLSHDGFTDLMKEAKKAGSFKEAVLAHADDYGIQDIEMLFPDAKAIGAPEVYSRRMGWVPKVLGGTKHTPFSKVKSIVFDITEDEARARGYIKGNQKKDEVVKLMKRTTGPTTIYKKQKLDRDDVIDIDITDINVVAWLKAEIRMMLEEEIARAILFGDGRSASNPDKIKDPEGANSGDGIRSILHDADFYAIKTDLPANVSPKDAVKGIIRARSKYRGTGKPTLFISDNFLTDIMLEEDKFGRPLYETEQVLADKLRVSEIVTVDIIDDTEDLFAILVNLEDYSLGTNRGGELTSFEDFDIDFNQMKYLMETRLSGALTKPFSAIVIRRVLGTEATATNPSFDGTTNTITIPTATGVIYLIDDEPVTGSVVITTTTEVNAVADEGYYLAPNTTREWTYTP
jgi:HK97 family phage prohead protease